MAGSFGGFAVALFFLLTLLHHFGLGWRGVGGYGGIGGRLFFLLQHDDVRDNANGVGDQLDFRRIERKIGGAQLLADHHVRNVDAEFFRNVGGQTFDFDFAGDGFENAALELHALRFAEGVHRHHDAHADVHGDAEQIHMQQLAADRIDLPVTHHGFLVAAIGHGDGEDGVVTGLGAQNLGDLLGVHGQRDGVLLVAVEHGRNHAGSANAARRTFAAAFSNLPFNLKVLHVSFPCQCKSAVLKNWDQVKSSLIDVSS